MKINIQAKNMELTPAIRDYVEKRVTDLEKFLAKIEEKGGEVMVNFEVCKTTHHHKSGDVFKADCSIDLDGKNFYSSLTKENLYEAIDDVKENLFREMSRFKTRKNHLFRRGAQKVKDMMKGLANFREK